MVGQEKRDCVYCGESLANEEIVFRGGIPLHSRCNAQLNHELAVWERETGLDHKEYDNVQTN